MTLMCCSLASGIMHIFQVKGSDSMEARISHLARFIYTGNVKNTVLSTQTSGSGAKLVFHVHPTETQLCHPYGLIPKQQIQLGLQLPLIDRILDCFQILSSISLTSLVQLRRTNSLDVTTCRLLRWLQQIGLVEKTQHRYGMCYAGFCVCCPCSRRTG